jgi:hypothetical protein
MARRYTRINAVCQSHKTAMEEEVKKILGVENETSTQDYFEKCTAAAKQVYENMDAVEKQQGSTKQAGHTTEVGSINGI